MNAAELTRQLEPLYRDGRTYEFIAGAHEALAALPSAPRLAALTFQALTDLELGGPARELLQLRAEFKHDAALAGHRETLGTLPNGRVPWPECRTIYERNAAALLRHRPHLRQLIDALPSHLARVQLYRTRGGEHYLARRRPGALREWLGNLSANPTTENLPLPAREKSDPAVVVGLRVGAVIERLLADTENKYLTFSPPLYLVEPDLVRFAAWMHVGDHNPLLDQERVYLFVGDQAAGDLTHQLERDPGLLIPEICVNQSGQASAGDLVTQKVKSIAASREREFAELKQALEQRYRDRYEAYWAKRFRKPGPILGLTSRFTTMLQYSMRDTLEALQRAGWDTEMTIESKDHQQVSGIEIARRILERDPVLVVLIDHLRYEADCLPRNIPLLSWIQDPMPNLLCPEAGASIGPFDFVCGYYLDRCTAEFGYPPDRFLTTEIPISETIFDAAPPDRAALALYACDISFVSNASEPIDRYYRSALASYRPEYRPLLEELYRRVREVHARHEGLSLQEGAPNLARSVAKELGITLSSSQVDNLTNHFVYRIYDWGRRQQTLEWVATWARRTGRVFKIYGRGWENHPTLASFAAGVVEHGEPLRLANQASRLALQLIPSGFRHQRSYEVLAAGTLPLTRYCEDDFAGLPVDDYMRKLSAGQVDSGSARFFPQLEHIVFRTPAEFESLAERFLSDEAHRSRVLSGLREIVLREHTYTAVTRRVLDQIQNVLTSQAKSSGGLRRQPAMTGV